MWLEAAPRPINAHEGIHAKLTQGLRGIELHRDSPGALA